MDVRVGPEGWVLKNWCFQSVVLENTLESPLDSKEMKPTSPQGSQPSISIGKTEAKAEAPILWLPDAKSWLIRNDPDAGEDLGQEKKRVTEDEMVGWHHRLSGHELEQTPGDSGGLGSLAWLQFIRLQRVEHNLATNNNSIVYDYFYYLTIIHSTLMNMPVWSNSFLIISNLLKLY